MAAEDYTVHDRATHAEISQTAETEGARSPNDTRGEPLVQDIGMTDDWFPLGMDDAADQARFMALEETFNETLQHFSQAWLAEIFSNYRSTTNEEEARRILLKFALPPSFLTWDPNQFVKQLVNRIGLEQLLDYTLAFVSAEDQDEELEDMLVEGRSVWTVGKRGEHPGLERRVDATAEREAERASRIPGAGTHLGAAWNALYGVDAEYAEAALEAAKAVEAAYGPIFQPNNQDRTGGTIYNTMRQGLSKWEVKTSLRHRHRPPQEMILDMLATVWALRDNAHASTPGRPTGRTREEATLAVSLAVTLVNLVQDGIVVPTTVDEGQV